jgi:hypothetical protein
MSIDIHPVFSSGRAVFARIFQLIWRLRIRTDERADFSFFDLGKSQAFPDMKRAYTVSLQLGYMPEIIQVTGYVFSQLADIGPFGAFEIKTDVRGVEIKNFEIVDKNFTGLALHIFAFSCQFV